MADERVRAGAGADVPGLHVRARREEEPPVRAEDDIGERQLRDPVDASGASRRPHPRYVAAPSCPAPATSDPSGENATRKAPPGDLRTRIRFAEGTDHSLTPASPAVATVLPSRAKSASVTFPCCFPVPSGFPSLALQRRTPPRASPVTTIAPSGLNLATDTGAPSCSVRSRAPVVEFQIPAVPSELAVTTRRPSGAELGALRPRACARGRAAGAGREHSRSGRCRQRLPTRCGARRGRTTLPARRRGAAPPMAAQLLVELGVPQSRRAVCARR